jgi:hypothetical protein
MSYWYRVFATDEVQPEPAALLEHIRGLCAEATGHFRGDDLGWFAAEFVFAKDETPLHLERFLTTEDAIRAELNTWAAWLETCDYSPNHQMLLQHMVSTKQLFTVRRPIDHSNEILVEKSCIGICQFLAQMTSGVYQVDNQGFFAADGTLLLQEY